MTVLTKIYRAPAQWLSGALLASLMLALPAVGQVSCSWQVTGEAFIEDAAGNLRRADFNDPAISLGVTSRWAPPDCPTGVCPFSPQRWQSGTQALGSDGRFSVITSPFTNATECARNRDIKLRLAPYGSGTSSRPEFALQDNGPALSAVQMAQSTTHVINVGTLCFGATRVRRCTPLFPADGDGDIGGGGDDNGEPKFEPAKNGCFLESAQGSRRYDLRFGQTYTSDDAVLSPDRQFRFLRVEPAEDQSGFTDYVFRAHIDMVDLDTDSDHPMPWPETGEDRCEIRSETKAVYRSGSNTSPQMTYRTENFWVGDLEDSLVADQQSWFRARIDDSFSGVFKVTMALDSSNHLSEADETNNDAGTYCFSTESLTFVSGPGCSGSPDRAEGR